MSRVGISPTRKVVGAYQPAAISVVVLMDHCKDAQGIRHGMAALERFLESVWKGASTRVDVLVWEQGCTPPMRRRLQRLQKAGWIQYLYFSASCRSAQTARWMLLAAAQGEHVLLWADGGLLLPGWQEGLQDTLGQNPGSILGLRPLGGSEDGRAQSTDLVHGGLWIFPGSLIQAAVRDMDLQDGDAPNHLMNSAFRDAQTMDVPWMTSDAEDEGAAAEKQAEGLLSEVKGYRTDAAPRTTALERVYDALFWFLTDARKEWIELDTD